MAVHTWTHPYMTSLSNEEVVAELGWTMEIIRQSSGGRIPKYWRPPYGDSDNRVNAIAKEVRIPFVLQVLTLDTNLFLPTRFLVWNLSSGIKSKSPSQYARIILLTRA